MTCGLCGSGISADEKYKKLKDGTFNTHIYYGCTKVRDKNCKCGYINENDLITQLQKLIDSVDLNQTSIAKKVKAEVVRYKKFNNSLLGKNTDVKATDIDIKDYVKFILKDGDVSEKRGVLSCIESTIFLSQKKITIRNS